MLINILIFYLKSLNADKSFFDRKYLIFFNSKMIIWRTQEGFHSLLILSVWLWRKIVACGKIGLTFIIFIAVIWYINIVTTTKSRTLLFTIIYGINLAYQIHLLFKAHWKQEAFFLKIRQELILFMIGPTILIKPTNYFSILSLNQYQ